MSGGKTGSTKPPATSWRWGPESVSEMSENLHILTQLSVQEDLIVLVSFLKGMHNMNIWHTVDET
jgi:hypothetical protein